MPSPGRKRRARGDHDHTDPDAQALTDALVEHVPRSEAEIGPDDQGDAEPEDGEPARTAQQAFTEPVTGNAFGARHDMRRYPRDRSRRQGLSRVIVGSPSDDERGMMPKYGFETRSSSTLPIAS